CMLSPRAVQFRQNIAKEQAIPMTNYVTSIGNCHGILKRSLEIFENLN
ncbi:MAG: [FeFe] hydrogenase H-cluster maturation GTPase HydF, partial [Oscillospiraceae bacterium]|nr:[FeFe] hydrogenase H-cluster maturation GTPase HydF [Oscillospiraceae bacterium]